MDVGAGSGVGVALVTWRGWSPRSRQSSGGFSLVSVCEGAVVVIWMWTQYVHTEQVRLLINQKV